MIDTHAHLNFDDFPDLDQVVERARQAGVAKIINIGSDLKTSRKAIELAGEYDDMHATVGVHPEDGKSDRSVSDIAKELAQMAGFYKVIAIGEAGLDYSRNPDESGKKRQKNLFEMQLDLAQEKGLPVVIHSRDADSDMLEILKNRSGIRGVVHCYTGDWEFAKKLLDLGLMISFTGIITFPKTAKLAEVVANIPLDRVMIETDCPLLAPQAYRGKRNEPAYAVEVAKKIAEIKGIGLEEVANATTKNAEEFFNIS